MLSVAELRSGETGDHDAVDELTTGFVLVAVDLAAAERGGRLRREFRPSHGTGLVDAILAATALQRGLTPITNNRRHFPMPGLALG